ncbi:TPA: cyclic diguanylate phosphodiesterase [Citrobacter koseri]|nr:cyclic diguanylate phosphodiesterase [Citrobacter koseri]
MIEKIIAYADDVNTRVLKLPYSSNSCERQLPEIRTIITTTPFIRSVLTGNGNTITCHSLIGKLNVVDTQREYQGGKLALLSGNLIQTRHPILLVRDIRGSFFSVSAIDGVYVQTVMQQLTESGSVIQFTIGNVNLHSDGSLSWESYSGKTVAFQKVSSDRYPFDLSVSLNNSSILGAWFMYQKMHIVLMALLFVVLSGVVLFQGRKSFSLDDDIKLGIKGNEFIAYGQRIVDLDKNSVSGMEILVRWIHPTEGIIRPDLFIPHAERSGMIIPMTRSLFVQVANHINSSSVPDGFYFSFNITAKHCTDMGLYDDCMTFLESTKDKNISLVLELTEREMVPQNEQTLRLFKMLNDAGVMIAIDDFGTGHSSLSYLHNQHITVLKLDQSFVAKINTDAVSGILIDSIIELAHNLSLKIIAEGIETKGQSIYLKRKGVKFAQGYLYGKPQPVDELLSSLRK